MGKYSSIDLHAIAHQAMAHYGFQANFPEAVLLSVSLMNADTVKDRMGSPADLRSLLWSSIDNTSSRDLDQLEYCVRGSNGEIDVKVAIADVDMLVPQCSPADGYAEVNKTSVYAGVEIFPMLPERLSTDLTSLCEEKDRVAVVIEFTVLADGSVRHGAVYRALVRNQARLTYGEIGDWLGGKTPLPPRVSAVDGLEDQLRLQEEASQRLQDFRMEQGALEFETIEATPVIREGMVEDLEVVRKNPARYLIENLMIAANVTMAKFLARTGCPMLQRVVREPKDWKAIREVAAARKQELPYQPDPQALSKFLRRQKAIDPRCFPDLSLTIIKLLGAGEYVVFEPGEESRGHFGLAVMDYTHATAPNRRFADIIIQRMLKASLDKRPHPYTRMQLSELAQSCTDRSKAAKKVERFMRKAMAAVVLEDRIGKVFDAIVTGAAPKGTYARISAPPVEGRIVKREAGLAVGQKVRLKLTGMDPYKGFIDFERV